MELSVEETFSQYFELATPEEVRAALRESAYYFIKKQVHYNTEELRAAFEIVNIIQPHNKDFSLTNKK